KLPMSMIIKNDLTIAVAVPTFVLCGATDLHWKKAPQGQEKRHAHLRNIVAECGGTVLQAKHRRTCRDVAGRSTRHRAEAARRRSARRVAQSGDRAGPQAGRDTTRRLA